MSTKIKTCEFVQTNLTKEDRPQTRTPLMMSMKLAEKYLRKRLQHWTDLDFFQLSRGGVQKTDPETGDTIKLQLIETYVDTSKRQRLDPDERGIYIHKNVESEK